MRLKDVALTAPGVGPIGPFLTKAAHAIIAPLNRNFLQRVYLAARRHHAGGFRRRHTRGYSRRTRAKRSRRGTHRTLGHHSGGTHRGRTRPKVRRRRTSISLRGHYDVDFGVIALATFFSPASTSQFIQTASTGFANGFDFPASGVS